MPGGSPVFMPMQMPMQQMPMQMPPSYAAAPRPQQPRQQQQGLPPGTVFRGAMPSEPPSAAVARAKPAPAMVIPTPEELGISARPSEEASLTHASANMSPGAGGSVRRLALPAMPTMQQ